MKKTIITYNHNSKYKYTCVLLILIIIINFSNQKCGTFNPKEESQCYTYNDENSLCCFISRFEGNQNKFVCHRIPLNEYANVMEEGFIKLGNFVYTSVNCGQTIGVNCNVNEPIIPQDCYQNNLSDNYCCMIEVPNKKKRCVYSGASVVADYTTNKGIKIRCSN